VLTAFPGRNFLTSNTQLQQVNIRTCMQSVSYRRVAMRLNTVVVFLYAKIILIYFLKVFFSTIKTVVFDKIYALDWIFFFHSSAIQLRGKVFQHFFLKYIIISIMHLHYTKMFLKGDIAVSIETLLALLKIILILLKSLSNIE
jgi:hypothetical protein